MARRQDGASGAGARGDSRSRNNGNNGNNENNGSRDRPPVDVDYVYKRCYVDNQGNFIDPRTPWDELLKYYRSWEMLLVSEGERRLMTPVPVKVRRALKLERVQRARLAQIHWMEAQYLKAKGEHRRRAARRKAYELEARYLGGKHNKRKKHKKQKK